MLWWVGHPEDSSEQSKDYPPILMKNGEILYRDNREKMEFEGDGMESAKKGLAELEQKDLIRTDRYGDIYLTKKGMFIGFGIRWGRFRKTPPDSGIRLGKKSLKEIEEARQRMLKEREAWRNR